ncbi:hypothetical protein [Bradyrhizobium erythrophlei]|uniref:Uncharacterized protein n=1 Tax=Bradyrhizobium erythrophlei TaxID=1437360 RepID=A0A1H4P0H4_9BRAD|nr:hypothetical protein [Bradyrhizobium erythrophlei]SEC00844.1 hypothetical protein SAMN05444164_0784 [Bradyrhizobium erythrophlei]
MQTNDDKPISPEELQMLKNARQQFVDVRSEFLRRASESENDAIVKINDNGRFDILVERVLSEIAYSDGPVNATR